MESSALAALSRQFEEAIEQAAERVFELAGERFNLNSGNQLGTILFEKMELDPNARRTQKTGQYQTSEQILRRLANRHEIARQVLDYRLHTKLKSTYVDQLPSAVFKATGRVHTNYEQLMTATGRMKSDRPNLQNIPIRSEQRAGNPPRLCAAQQRVPAVLGRLLADPSCGLPRRSAATRGCWTPSTAAATSTSPRPQRSTKSQKTKRPPRCAARPRRSTSASSTGSRPFGLAERLDIPRWQALRANHRAVLCPVSGGAALSRRGLWSSPATRATSRR